MNCHRRDILFLTLHAGTEVDIYVIFQVAGISHKIDACLVKKSDELVREGVSNVHEMKRHLQIFVKSTIFTSDQLLDVSNDAFSHTTRVYGPIWRISNESFVIL